MLNGLQNRYNALICLTNLLTSLLIFKNVITIQLIVIHFINHLTLYEALHNDTLY
jgi:hypothetical protein